MWVFEGYCDEDGLHGFFGKDPAFMNWASELFLHYWSQAKHS